MAFLLDAGLLETQVQLKDGPNPDERVGRPRPEGADEGGAGDGGGDTVTLELPMPGGDKAGKQPHFVSACVFRRENARST